MPLYKFFDGSGAVKITTERLANSHYTGSGHDAPYLAFKADHPEFIGSLSSLYQHFNPNGETVVIDDPFEGLVPYIQEFVVGGTAGGRAVQPLYFDAHGNLTTQNTGDQDWRIGFQRTAGGLPLYLDLSGNLTTTASYRQAIVVVNDLVYLDGENNQTLEPTNNRQDIDIDTSSRAVALYPDANGNPTTRLSNPSLVVTNASADSLLYYNDLGQKTTSQTPTRVYAATNSNVASLIYYDDQGLDVPTPDQPAVPRVLNNGTNPGSAQYDLTRNQKATIETYRQELVVGTKPFQMVRTVTDAGTDTLIVNATNAVTHFTLTDTQLTGLRVSRRSSSLPRQPCRITPSSAAFPSLPSVRKPI